MQVWYLAPQLVNSENALDIANNFFTGIVSTENFTFMDEIGLPVIRMKVKVDLSKPLPRGFYVGEDTDWIEKDWASFKYERLPSICWFYGMFDHTTPKCRDLMVTNTRKLEYLPSNIKAFPAKELSKFRLNLEYSPADYRLTPMLECVTTQNRESWPALGNGNFYYPELVASLRNKNLYKSMHKKNTKELKLL